MKLLRDILLEEVVEKFEDPENQSDILNNIDSKGNYVHEKLEEHLVSLGFPKGANEYAGDIEWDVEVLPNDAHAFVVSFMEDYVANPEMQFDLDNMNEDDEDALEEMIDDIIPYATKNPKLLKFIFNVETTLEEFNNFKQ